MAHTVSSEIRRSFLPKGPNPGRNVSRNARRAILAASVAMMPAFAMAEPMAEIDAQLAGQIDFRADAFQGCMDKQSCTVGDITASAYRRTAEDADWVVARLYWDAVDGLGVLDGGQNDEIDFDEKIVVSFASPKTVKTIWLSDLFISEEARYSGVSLNDEDSETAEVEMRMAGATAMQMRITGNVDLPNTSFNEDISKAYVEDGDLLTRLVMDQDTTNIVVPGLRENGEAGAIRAQIGQIDKDKLEIFAGVPTVEVDISTILANAKGMPVFPTGKHNEQQVARMLLSPSQIADLRKSAEAGRVIGTKSNGEVAGVLPSPVTTDELVFATPIETSNDYSIAGLVLAR